MNAVVSKGTLEGIAVFLQVEGKLYWAPITEQMSMLFVGMIPAYQPNSKAIGLIEVPDNAAQKVFQAQELINAKLKGAA
ncbi:hypothetical protein CCO03_08515 [Comamonas serinivorans]|uniref:Uncharacterized protein n=1 Tax=Comamonas serinivorans TaxID=1082851 RepID=A0A1Y0EMM8_9BURK|nr:hypothetical protein [Comamonas serinivorans]ARU04711.1 hypothetical protein CCO03_08515 [Comamonas serinivorans]